MSSDHPEIQGSPRPSSTVNPATNPSERRHRRRVKVSASVRVRATDPNSDTFTDIATTIDVSRDGILFQTERRGFSKGMPVGVTFPYSNAQGALNVEQPAQVVRTMELGDNKIGVAIQFRHVQQKAAAAIAAAGPGSKEKSSTHGASTALKGAPIQAPVARPIVLAAESDPRLQEQLKNLLTPEGYDVFAVGTGAAALDILRTTVPSCFIAEVELGDTSGYDLCLIIKNSERLARVPVVLLTSSATPSDYAASHNFGAVVCMAKPFKPERMLQVVRLVAPPPAKPGASQYGTSRGEASLIERNL
ncbi:MAG TPA: response regulator [Candidatus Acidoferrales bacterium]|nr:response regulator [Candidatus Acidoferrales bacterium]